MDSNDTNTTLRRRQRSHNKEITTYEDTFSKLEKVSSATAYSGYGEDDDEDKGTIRIFRSSTARVALIISSLALLLFSIINLAAQRATNIKELSDTVIQLNQQLAALEGENLKKIHERETLEKQVVEKDIELAWEHQEVNEVHNLQKQMEEQLVAQANKDHEMIIISSKAASEYAQKAKAAENKLDEEHEENAKLKVSLAIALEELSKVRQQFPPPPGTEKVVRVKKERKLRAEGTFQPGDSVSIIEYEDADKIALRPGIVTDVNGDDTYNCVMLERSKLIKNLKRHQFQAYALYPPGTLALYEVKKDVYVPIEIVDFNKTSAREGFELHGSYLFKYDNSDQEASEGAAMRMHRYVDIGEFAGVVE